MHALTISLGQSQHHISGTTSSHFETDFKKNLSGVCEQLNAKFHACARKLKEYGAQNVHRIEDIDIHF